MKRWCIVYTFSKRTPLTEDCKKRLMVDAVSRPLAVKQLKHHLDDMMWRMCIIVDCIEVKPELN